MVAMAEGGSSLFLFNLRKILSHRITVLSVTALLAVYVLWQAGSLVWKLWLLNDESPQAEVLIPSSLKNAEPELLQNLLSYPLIRTESNQAATGPASADKPKTSLKLKLVGLMYSTDKDQARAIIVSEKDGARSYSNRERVADKVEIFSIEPDRVILLHAGRQEALMLDPEEGSSGNRPDTEDEPVKNSGKDQASAAVQSTSGRNRANAPRRTEDLMEDFSATPVMEEGELVGFRLQALRDPEIMNEWGIGPDDVITAVNGVPLNSQGKIMVLYDKLKKEKEFALTLNNGGKSRTVTVDLTE